MTTITHRFVLEAFYTFSDKQHQEEKQFEVKREQNESDKSAHYLNQLTDEIDTFIQQRKEGKHSTQWHDDALPEQGTRLKFKLKNLLQDAQQSGKKQAPETEAATIQALLSRLVDAENQWEADSLLTEVKGGSTLSSVGEEMPDTQTNKVLSLLNSLQQSGKVAEHMSPQVNRLDLTTVNTNAPEAEEVTNQSDPPARLGNLLQQLMNILLSHPAACHRTMTVPQSSYNVNYPPLPPPTRQPVSIQQLIAALMKLKEFTSILVITIQSEIAEQIREITAAITIKVFKKNEEILEAQKKSEKTNNLITNILKWVVRALSIIAGALTAFTPFGALLLAVSITDIILEETVGVSIMGTLMKPVMMLFEQIAKGFTKLLEVCGAVGNWVEAVSMVMAMITMLVLTKGAGVAMDKLVKPLAKKLFAQFPVTFQSACKQTFLTTFRSLSKAMSAMKTFTPNQKIMELMKLLASKTHNFIPLALSLVQTCGEVAKLPANIRLSELEIEKSKSEAELSDADFINELVTKLLSGINQPLNKILTDREEMTDMATNMQNMENRLNYTLAGNVYRD
jgi:hypothetical protein